MRICHVSPHLPPDQAANALLPAELAAWSRSRGDDVALVSYEPAQGRPAAPVDAHRVWRLPRRPAESGPSRLLRLGALRHARAVQSVLDEAARGADVLHLHSNGLLIEAAAAWARSHQVRYVLTLYGTEIWHFRPRWPVDPFRRAYDHARAVTFYSRKLMEKARALGLERPSMSVVYPAIAPAFAARNDNAREALRRALGIAERQVVLNVKRLHELAGQRYLIDAFARVARARRDVRLVICGTGPLRTELETQARQSGQGDRITFTGLLPNDRIADYAAMADVFALPSLLEALPTVAVEALASGTPVVSADHPGGTELHELFGDDVTVVQKGDVDGLAVALADALDHPRRASEATLATVRAEFSPEAIHGRYAYLYAG